MTKILLIDHDDSFTHILAQYFGKTSNVTIINQRDITPNLVRALKPSHLVLSPGPGNPKEYPNSKKTLEIFHKAIPILGVCLGHQMIAAYFGAKILQTQKIMHGKKSLVIHDSTGLFKDIKNPVTVMRYHSLCAKNIPKILRVTAKSEDNVIMGIEHTHFPIYGIQFHPESIATEEGLRLIENFVNTFNVTRV